MVNIADRKTIEISGKILTTGIFTHPLPAKVSINADGLVGDSVVRQLPPKLSRSRTWKEM
jgi:MOSC domain-containing protein YiiM